MMKSNSKKFSTENDLFTDEIPVQYYPNRGGTYKANLFGPIHSPSQFASIISVLDIMKEEDELVLSISSGGGSLCAVDALLHAMKKTEGSVHCIATGDVSSAATFVLLMADSYELSEGFEATLHCGSLGYGGNYNEVATSAPFQLQHMQKYLRSAYEGFIDEDRLEALFKGQDILLDAEQWVECSNNRQAYFIAKHEQEQAALLAAQEPTPKPQRKPLTIGKQKALQGPTK